MKYIVAMLLWITANAWLWSYIFNEYVFEEWTKFPLPITIAFYVVGGFAYIVKQWVGSVK